MPCIVTYNCILQIKKKKRKESSQDFKTSMVRFSFDKQTNLALWTRNCFKNRKPITKYYLLGGGGIRDII